MNFKNYRDMETHATFKVFREIMEIIMNTDNLSEQEEDEFMNEWFEDYKGTKYFDVIEFAKFWFNDVERSTHDYWLDKRGLMLYELKGMLNVSGIFPVF